MVEGDFQRPARQLTPSACEREFTLGSSWVHAAHPLEAFPPLVSQLTFFDRLRFCPVCFGSQFAPSKLTKQTDGSLHFYGVRTHIRRL
jgi:hypothetical protein